jgi:hypothetical protein
MQCFVYKDTRVDAVEMTNYTKYFEHTTPVGFLQWLLTLLTAKIRLVPRSKHTPSLL